MAPHPIHRLAAAALAAAVWTAPALAQPATFAGTVRYEKILASPAGLLLDAPTVRPAAGVRVEVVSEAGGRVLAADFADDKGRYLLEVPSPPRGNVRVRALARTRNASVVGVEVRSGYAAESPPLAVRRGGRVEHDLLADEATRLSGAFNIAVTIERANAFIRAADPAVDIPRVEVRWDTAYVGGTFFRSRESAAHINGLRSRDSDEFDDHVIIHEYAHFLMAALSRESSPGGSHSSGERLDPRLAWSEGWANFFAAAVLGDSRYVDTGAARGRQTVRVSMDLEDDLGRRDDPGVWSEHSVASLLWDWFDDGPEMDDTVAFGFAPMWEAFVRLRKAPAAYLLDFADALAARVKDPAELAPGLLARSIEYAPGAEPPSAKPFPTAAAPGTPVRGTVDSRSTRRGNLWGSSAHYWFVLPEERQVSVKLEILDANDPARADLDLYLFDADDERVASSDAVNGVGDTEAISRRLPAGYYRLEVRSWSRPTNGRLADAGAHQGTYSLLVKY